MGIVGTLETALPVGHSVQKRRAGRSCCWAVTASADCVQFGGTPVCESSHRIHCGASPEARYGVRKARAGRDSRAGRSESGGVGARLERRRSGGCVGGMLVRRRRIGCGYSTGFRSSPELLLFHEGPSRILVSTANPDAVLADGARNTVSRRCEIGVTLEVGD